MDKKDTHKAPSQKATARKASGTHVPGTPSPGGRKTASHEPARPAAPAWNKPENEPRNKPENTPANDPVKPKNKHVAQAKQAIKFISHDIWIKKEHEYSPKQQWLVRQAKIILFTARGVSSHNIVISAAALTFYTIMALVPILALTFAISKGFGLEARLDEFLYTEFPSDSALTDQLLGFANNMLERTRSGIIASVGVLVLFWSVIKVLTNIERAFNRIWEVRKARSVYRKFTDYLAAVAIAPILLIGASSTSLYVQSLLSNFTPTAIIRILLLLMSIAFMVGLMTFIYQVMPNTKVKARAAFTGAVISGPVLMIFQTLYFSLQATLSNYNAIYGTFAAIPLFLIWLQASWQIVLFGAELSFAYQNINKYEYEKTAANISYEYRKKVMVAVMYEIAHHYVRHEGAVSSEMIADRLELPLRTVRDVIYNLLKADLIAPIVINDQKTHYYVPSQDVHSIRVFDIIKDIEHAGYHEPVLESNPKLAAISNIMDGAENDVLSSANNVLLMDLDIP